MSGGLLLALRAGVLLDVELFALELAPVDPHAATTMMSIAETASTGIRRGHQPSLVDGSV